MGTTLPGRFLKRPGGWADPSLQSWLVALVILVLFPTLAVLAGTLLHASRSYRDASGRHLLEAARLIAQSVLSELDATSHLLAGDALHGTGNEAAGAYADGSRHTLRLRRGPDGYAPESPARLPGQDSLVALAVRAANAGDTVLSDIFPDAADGTPRLAIAVPRLASLAPPGLAGAEMREIALLVARPDALVRALSRPSSFDTLLALAVTDGTGHVISRSRDAADFVGKPAPDWARPRADGGTFAARTLEGSDVVLAFQPIGSTPGWMAVAGESRSVFNDRWQGPVRMMVLASVGAVLAALLLASLLARRILRPIEQLVLRAGAVARGRGFDPPGPDRVPPFSIAEFETLRRSLDEADAALRKSVEAEREVAKTLATNERRYRTIAQIGALAFWVRDRSGTMKKAAGLLAMAGIREELVLGEDWQRRIHPQDRPGLDSSWATALKHLAPLDTEFRLRTPMGGWRWLRARGAPVPGEDGQPAEWIGVLEDITPRKDVEQALQRSYETLREAEKLARIGSWRLDLATGLFEASDMLHELSATPPGGLRVTPAELGRLMAPASLARLQAAMAQCRETGLPFTTEIDHLRSDGSRFPAQVRGQAVLDGAGRIIGLNGTVQDVTERHEERARLAALADNLPSSALYRLEETAEGRLRITYISTGVLELLGVPAEAVVKDRRAFLSTIHPDDLPGYEAAIRQTQLAFHVFDETFRARTHDGRDIWMQCRSAPRLLPDGRIVWDGIMRDITRERQAAETLRQAKERAEEAERGKSDFLATMSHEIRTPMNTVLGMTRLALRTGLAPRQRNYLEKIDASAQSLLGIINDILDFSRIEAGGMALEDTVFMLETVLESVSAITAMRAEEKGLEIAFSIGRDVPRQLRGDPLRLGQVLTNLVSNAVKFTAAGEVVVAIALVRAADGGALLEFAVRDTGIGLDETQIAGLFRPFAQGDAGTARRYGGTGLGLAICRRLVKMMGGRIWVESRLGLGSEFFFTIPACPAEGAGDLAPHRAGLSGRRALIVDDNASAREILLCMVRDFGMAAEAVESGPEAIARLTHGAQDGQPFDIVLMDWRMPGIDGLEAARLMRAEASLMRMPAVLMVTAFGREDVLRSIEMLGLQGLLVKPVTESVMFNTITDILASPGAMEGTRNQVQAPCLPDGLLASLAGKRVLVVDDNALNREVAGGFLADAGMLAGMAENGRDALLQLAGQDYDAVLMDVHMPEMNGLAATREIRRQPRWAGLPIIALTAQARGEDRQASLEAGMTAHLTKPIDEQKLYRVLAEVMAETRTPPPAPAGQPAGAGLELDMAAVSQRLGGKPARVARLLSGFIRDFAEGPDRMASFLCDGDATQAATLAHTVRGSAAYLGATTFCATAARLEQAILGRDDIAIAALLPPFSTQLRLLLEATHASLEALRATAVDAVLAGDLLTLAEAVMPLVASGDYAAHAMLEQLAQSLEGQPAQALARQAGVCFDELDLMGATAALRRLLASLETPPP
jgi:two-component system sensor histidine kinase/response regulator